MLLHRTEAVSLLTLHASKGLEFSVVFVAGCEEGLLPHFFPGEDVEARLPEERRLMYVGLTRARKMLVLTHAAQRMVQGRPQPQKPSRFLTEITEDLLLHIRPAPLPPRRKNNQLSLF